MLGYTVRIENSGNVFKIQIHNLEGMKRLERRGREWEIIARRGLKFIVEMKIYILLVKSHF